MEPLTSAETIDLDDNETRNRIMAEVVDHERLQRKSKESEELAYASDQQKPYKGWAKFSDATSVPMGAFYAYVTKVQ